MGFFGLQVVCTEQMIYISAVLVQSMLKTVAWQKCILQYWHICATNRWNFALNHWSFSAGVQFGVLTEVDPDSVSCSRPVGVSIWRVFLLTISIMREEMTLGWMSWICRTCLLYSSVIVLISVRQAITLGYSKLQAQRKQRRFDLSICERGHLMVYLINMFLDHHCNWAKSGKVHSRSGSWWMSGPTSVLSPWRLGVMSCVELIVDILFLDLVQLFFSVPLVSLF